MHADELERAVRLLDAHRAIEQKIYRMGYALEDGDFALVGDLLQHPICAAPPQRTGGSAAETTSAR